ncbi:hypothetical protein [Phyllobacterium sophorae]|uniref:Auto-transporter adhesin head GIN domain-containing protein n=1 Tax=Phyllobacterium sophorae TaxID=1520277 RepID=A0A2P7BAK9_9HYPH|nr:hypothetical protein [Phyllobacterium sophorae]PSH63508.1 hypothetical protein CU103_14680 [Phyllobacterium sophorae]
MLNLYVSILLLFQTLTPTAASAEALKAPLDIAQIKNVSITGEASRVEFTTTDTLPWSVAMTSIRSGWLSNWTSSWFSNACETASTMVVKDQALLIHVVNAPWLSLSDCEVRIRANLPKNSDVSIEQHALYARLSGDYRRIRVDGNAADFALDGYASSLDVTGDAVRTDIRLERTNNDETILLNSHALDASFSFGGDMAISYAVNAKASFIDSKRANTPGAKPSIDIKSEFVRATIR